MRCACSWSCSSRTSSRSADAGFSREGKVQGAMPFLRRLGEASAGLALGAAAASVPSTGADPAEPAVAPPAVAPPAVDTPMREHADDVVDYTMHAVLDVPQHTVHGDGTIVWKNRSNVAVRELWFHLYLNAFKNERTVFLRAPVA